MPNDYGKVGDGGNWKDAELGRYMCVWGGRGPEKVWEELGMAQTWAQKTSRYAGRVRVNLKIMLCETVSFFFPQCLNHNF